jgi:hypothetical protein
MELLRTLNRHQWKSRNSLSKIDSFFTLKNKVLFVETTWCNFRQKRRRRVLPLRVSGAKSDGTKGRWRMRASVGLGCGCLSAYTHASHVNSGAAALASGALPNCAGADDLARARYMRTREKRRAAAAAAAGATHPQPPGGEQGSLRQPPPPDAKTLGGMNGRDGKKREMHFILLLL